MPGRKLAFAALCLFAVSWFVPVHGALWGSGGPYDAAGTLDFKSGTPPGWRAFRMAWTMMNEGGNEWQARVLGFTCLTNFVMVLAAVVLMSRARVWPLGALLLLCAVFNSAWIYLNLEDPEFIGGLEIGYYLWTFSFGLAGAAFLRR